MEYRTNVEQIQKNINNNTKYPFVEEEKKLNEIFMKVKFTEVTFKNDSTNFSVKERNTERCN